MTRESPNRKIQSNVILILISLAVAASFLFFVIKAVYDPAIPFLKTDTNANWILYPLSAELEARGRNFINLTTEFAKNFELAAKPSKVYLHIKGFNEYRLWINDNQPPVDSTNKKNWKKAQVLEISQFLKEGTNTIRVKVTNKYSPPALWLYSEGMQNNLKTDTTWSVFIMDSPAASAGLAEDCFMHPISSQSIHPFEALSKKSLMLILFFIISSAVFWISHHRQIFTPKRILMICVIVWIILFINNTAKTPIIKGFDSSGHFDYIQYILDHKSIPLANEGWETFQPPLFYFASAMVMSLGRLFLNPNNALFSLKLIPFLCGIGQICLAYFAARVVFPDSKTRQSLSIIIAAVIPMNIYISGFISNESSSAFLMGLAILLTIIILNRSRSSSRMYLVLGLVTGLALLTKFTILAILPVIFLVILYKLFYEEKCPVAKMGGNLGLMCLASIVIAGWFFVRNWIHFGKVLVGNWDCSLLLPQLRWWQDPGFHTYKYFCQFGKVFSLPYYAGTYSLFDSLYSSFWGDAYFSGAVSYSHRSPWNYEYMSAIYLLAIPACLAIIVGTVCATVNVIRKANKIWLLILGSFFTITYSIVYMVLQISCYGQAKASYGLGVILPISLIFAFGFGWADNLLKSKRLFLLRMVLYGWFGTLILTILLSFIVTQSQVDALPSFKKFVLEQEGKLGQMVTYYTQLLHNTPDDWEAHNELGNTYFLQRKYDDAIEQYKTALKLRPMWADAMYNIANANILNTNPNATSADKAQAVQYAELSCRLTGYLNLELLQGLVASYLATGQSAQAITTAERTIKIAASSGRQETAEEIQKWLREYKGESALQKDGIKPVK